MSESGGMLPLSNLGKARIADPKPASPGARRSEHVSKSVENALRRLGFHPEPEVVAAYKVLEAQGEAITRPSLRALSRDLGELAKSLDSSQGPLPLKALGSLLLSARTAGVEFNPRALLEAASLGLGESGPSAAWIALINGLERDGHKKWIKDLHKHFLHSKKVTPQSLRKLVEGSGMFSEARWGTEARVPDDLKITLIRLKKFLEDEGAAEERIAEVDDVLGRIRRIQRSFDLMGGSMRIRSEIPSLEGPPLALSVTRRKGRASSNEPVRVSVWIHNQDAKPLRADLILQGKDVDIDFRAPVGMAQKIEEHLLEFTQSLSRAGLNPRQIRTKPEAAA